LNFELWATLRHRFLIFDSRLDLGTLPWTAFLSFRTDAQYPPLRFCVSVDGRVWALRATWGERRAIGADIPHQEKHLAILVEYGTSVYYTLLMLTEVVANFNK
jgi:hypothetical protein